MRMGPWCMESVPFCQTLESVSQYEACDSSVCVNMETVTSNVTRRSWDNLQEITQSLSDTLLITVDAHASVGE